MIPFCKKINSHDISTSLYFGYTNSSQKLAIKWNPLNKYSIDSPFVTLTINHFEPYIIFCNLHFITLQNYNWKVNQSSSIFFKLTLISLTTLRYFDNEIIGSTNISNTNTIVLFYSEANVNKRMNNWKVVK